MASHLKMLIISKMLPNLVEKDIISQYIKSMRVIYKTDYNIFFLDINNANIPKEHRHLATNKDESIMKIVHTESENCRIEIERNFFIKQILAGVLGNTTKVNNNSKKIVMDFSSPNIAKPFHVGHLRSTIIGNFIANINKHYNNNVVRINYLGDWGTQFGLLQYGLKKSKINLQDIKCDPMKTLFNAYVSANKLAGNDESVQAEARKYFADIEQGISNLDDWKTIRQITVEELDKTYRRLGIHFDAYNWESDYNGKAIQPLMKFLEKQNIVYSDSTGKKVARVNDRDVAVLKSDDSTLYLSRDIAALIDRYEKYKFDEMLYVVDNSQSDHFKALVEIVGMFEPKCAEGCKHIKFGRIKGMSTRSGNVVFLNDILDEAKEKMYEQQLLSKNTRSSAVDEPTCDTLGATAVIINDLKQNRRKDYTFNWERILQSEGDSGIKLQYLHCRLWSLEQNCGVTLPEECDPGYLKEPIMLDLIAEIAKFEDVLLRAKEEYEACVLVAYLFRLTKIVNKAFKELKIKNVDVELGRQRLLVFHAARIVMKSSLEILGVKPLLQM